MGSSVLKDRIDEIDEQIVKLFTERLSLSNEISKNGDSDAPVIEQKHEKEKLSSFMKNAPGSVKEYLPMMYSLLTELDRTSRRRSLGNSNGLAERITAAINETPSIFPSSARVACQGIEGANSHFACDKLFRNANIMFFSTFDAVFTAIEKGICRYGVIPVENSTAGSVNKVYDLMMGHNFSIVKSIRLKIDHNLLALPGSRIEDIKEIYSHEQAISQCSEYLGSLKGVKIIPCENTAVAAKLVAESKRNDMAALASRPCIDYYGLECLSASVQNSDNNYTRFICISNRLEIYPGADRTSIMFILPHSFGSLYRFISKLYTLGINLNKVESRPLPGREFEFMFYFDLDIPVYSPQLLQLAEELPYICESYQYLGSYSEVI